MGLLKKYIIDPLVEGYRSESEDTTKNMKKGSKRRTDISQADQDEIDRNQRIPASEEFQNEIIARFYSDFPEKPFISKDSEIRNNWIEASSIFPQVLIKKEAMERLDNGMLPGEVYLLYWISKTKRSRVPVYFERKYGINFWETKQLLQESGYLTEDGKLTDLGEETICKYSEVIKNHKLH